MQQDDTQTSAIEHQERWHHSDTYILPTDNEENTRLQFQHEILRQLFDDRLVVLPIEFKSGDEILDVGTGKAAWALDFLKTYPVAAEQNIKLICIDISDHLFPASHPQNISFGIHNVLDLPAEWENRFSFIHQRLLMAALKKDEWAEALAQIYRVARPGGWAQLCEANAISHMDGCGPAYARFMDLYQRLFAAMGLDPACSLNIAPAMQRIGFVNVKTESRTVHLGEWNGEVGAQFKVNMMAVYRGFKTTILRLGGLGVVTDEADFDSLMDSVSEEWNKPGAVVGFYMITGQKPFN